MADLKDTPAWKVCITDAAGKLINRKGSLSDDDKRVIQTWARTVQKHGPDFLRDGPVSTQTWADHDLSGAWAGYRASRFSSSGRIIYKVIDKIVCVAVVRITTTHDYGTPSREELKEIARLERTSLTGKLEDEK